MGTAGLNCHLPTPLHTWPPINRGVERKSLHQWKLKWTQVNTFSLTDLLTFMTLTERSDYIISIMRISVVGTVKFFPPARSQTLFSWIGTRLPWVKDESFFYVTLQQGHWNLQRIEHSLIIPQLILFTSRISSLFSPRTLEIKTEISPGIIPNSSHDKQTAGG